MVGKTILNNVSESSDIGRLIGQYSEKVCLYKETSDKAEKAHLKADIANIKRIIGENAQPDLFEVNTTK